MALMIGQAARTGIPFATARPLASWLAFALLMLLGGCVAPAAPEVRLIGLAPLESTVLAPRMRLDMRLINPGTRALSVRGVDLALTINEVELARGVDDAGFDLPPLGEALASVEVSASLLKLVQLLLTLPEAEAFQYSLNGQLHVRGFPGRIGFERSGALTRAQLRTLSGGGRRPGSLRLE